MVNNGAKRDQKWGENDKKGLKMAERLKRSKMAKSRERSLKWPKTVIKKWQKKTTTTPKQPKDA